MSKYKIGDMLKRDSDGKIFVVSRVLGKETYRSGGGHSYLLRAPSGSENPIHDTQIAMYYRAVAKRMQA